MNAKWASDELDKMYGMRRHEWSLRLEQAIKDGDFRKAVDAAEQLRYLDAAKSQIAAQIDDLTNTKST